MNSLIVITGQTATGKTKLALEYAKNPPAGGEGELINADSRQVYKHLDIITGKDLEEIQKNNIKVHLLNLVTPDQEFNTFDFVDKATKVIIEIRKRNKTPIIVGGTYQYIKHLLYGQDVQVPANPKLREQMEKLPVEELQKKLHSLDKTVYSKLNNSDANNPRRLIRRIEILTSPNASIKSIKPNESEDRYGLRATSNTITGLKHKSRESLVKAIIERVEKRFKQGALDEVKHLLKLGYKKTDPGLQTIGYKQLIAHLEGDMTLEQAKQDWINKEVQYAKRQLTFMKTNVMIDWKDL